MDNQTKLSRLLDAIEDITTYPDGSITIAWKASVGHYIPGHSVTFCQQSIVNKAHQIHLNPELILEKSHNYSQLQEELDEGIRVAKEKAEKQLHYAHLHGCGI